MTEEQIKVMTFGMQHRLLCGVIVLSDSLLKWDIEEAKKTSDAIIETCQAAIEYMNRIGNLKGLGNER